jgi:hypothetical protein
MTAFKERIVELASSGQTPKTITETLKAEGVRTNRGKRPTIFNVRNQVAAAKKNGLIAKLTSDSAVYNGFDATLAKTCTDAFVLAKNVLNNDTLAAERKIDMLKILFR